MPFGWRILRGRGVGWVGLDGESCMWGQLAVCNAPHTRCALVGMRSTRCHTTAAAYHLHTVVRTHTHTHTHL